MNWKSVRGSTLNEIRYEANPEDGVRLRIEPVGQNDWPSFRWTVHLDVGGRLFHHEETAVDLLAAKYLAEKYMLLSLSALKEK